MHPFLENEEEEPGLQDLLIEINRRYMGKCFRRFMELGIYPGQLPILGMLKKHDGYSQKELAEHIHVKPPTVTVTIQRLEKAGMVYRKPDEKDQRVARIFLSEKGRAAMDNALAEVKKYERLLFRGFGETELCLMRRFFQQIIGNIDEIPEPDIKEDMKKEEL